MAIKAEFQRVNNVVLMTILEQGDEIQRTCGIVFNDSQNNVCIKSMSHANILSSGDNIVICVRGGTKEKDYYTTCLECENVSIAKYIINRCTKAIENYNKACKEEEDYPDTLDRTPYVCIVG
jgi:hypothetical protein